MVHRSGLAFFSSLSLLVAISIASATGVSSNSQRLLRENWFIQSSADVPSDGPTISKTGFSTQGWYPATLPSTVLSALVEDKVYPDPYLGMILRSIPGTTYPIFEDFSNIQMPPSSPFRQSWWYRTEFKLPAEYKGKTLWLEFDGINYRANVWMNGVQVATSDQLSGTWRLFRFAVNLIAKPGDNNALAIEVFPPQPRDLAITLVDWAPMPPDKEMGVWRDVRMVATGPIAMRYSTVLTSLNLPSTDQAALMVRTELTNASNQAVEAVLKGRIEDRAFEQPVRLAPRETQVIRLTPEKFHQLTLPIRACGGRCKWGNRNSIRWICQSRPRGVSRLLRSYRPDGKLDLAQQKPYTGTHNSGYTECQEFFGAITLDSQEPLGNQIVTMLDVALRGIGDRWNDVVIPGFDFCVVENTFGKYGTRVETLTKFPIHAQELVGCVAS